MPARLIWPEIVDDEGLDALSAGLCRAGIFEYNQQDPDLSFNMALGILVALIVKCDREGRHRADGHALARVWHTPTGTAEKILALLDEGGFIHLGMNSDGKLVLELKNFGRYQSGLESEGTRRVLGPPPGGTDTVLFTKSHGKRVQTVYPWAVADGHRTGTRRAQDGHQTGTPAVAVTSASAVAVEEGAPDPHRTPPPPPSTKEDTRTEAPDSHFVPPPPVDEGPVVSLGGNDQGRMAPSVVGPPDPSDEIGRIRRAFHAACVQDNHLLIPKPSEDAVIVRAAEMGTCESFATDEQLTEEMRRTLAGLKSKGYNLSIQACLNHLGESWEDRKVARNGDVPREENSQMYQPADLSAQGFYDEENA